MKYGWLIAALLISLPGCSDDDAGPVKGDNGSPDTGQEGPDPGPEPGEGGSDAGLDGSPTDSGDTPHPDAGDSGETGPGSEAEILATGKGHVYSVALDDTYLYWAGAFGLERIPKAGGAVEPLSTRSSTAVAIKDGTIYFVSSTALYSMPVSGGADQLLSQPPGLSGHFMNIAVTSDYVLWSSSSAIRSYPRAGGNFTIVPMPCNGCGPRGFAADDSHLYWLTSTGGHHVVRWLFEGSTLESVTDTGGISFAMSDSHVYIGNHPGLQRAVKGVDSILEDLAGEETGRVQYLVPDATHLYWTEGLQAAPLRRIPLDGGTIEIVATTKDAVWDRLAVDDTHVYLVDGTNEVISRVAKTP